MSECEVNLQWKGIDACYDFYCPCGWQGADPPSDGEPDNHEDGYFRQEFQCGGCGQWWHLPNKMIARPGKFFRDDNLYGCDDCATGHRTMIEPGGPQRTSEVEGTAQQPKDDS